MQNQRKGMSQQKTRSSRGHKQTKCRNPRGATEHLYQVIDDRGSIVGKVIIPLPLIKEDESSFIASAWGGVRLEHVSQ